MTAIAYRKHFMVLSIAVIGLHLAWRGLYWMPASNIRDITVFALPGALHALALVVSLQRKATIARGIAFLLLAGLVNLVTPAFGLAAYPLLPVVPAIVRMFPLLREIGDSTPGDSVRFLLVAAAASACGALAYWFLIRAFWMKFLRREHLPRTLVLCVLATSLGFFGPALFRTPENFESTRGLADIFPVALWWLAFSLSLFWVERSTSTRTVNEVLQPKSA